MNPFLQQVCENSDDDSVRLVYADWLDDREDPQGEFIRTQCELANTSELDPDYEDLSIRSDELLYQYRDQWVPDMLPGVRKAEFSRGFLSSVTLLARRFPQQAEALFSTMPVQSLRLNRVAGTGASIAECEQLARLRHLDLGRLKIPPEDLLALLGSPHLHNLASLKLNHTNTSWDAALATGLAEMASAAQLKELHVAASFGDTFKAKFSASAFPSLERLELGAEYGSRDLLGMGGVDVPRLRSLSLAGRLGVDVCKDLAQLPLSQLERFTISGSKAAARGLKAFADQGAFVDVEELALNGASMGSIARNCVFASDQLRRCRVLAIDHDENGKHGKPFVESLATHVPLQNLRRLLVGSLNAGQSCELFRSDVLQQVDAFAAPNSVVSADDLGTLATSPWAARLRSLDLGGVYWHSDVTEIRGKLPKLLRLDLSGPLYQQDEQQVRFVLALLRQLELPALQMLRLDWQWMLGEQVTELLLGLELPELRRLELREVRFKEQDLERLLDSPRLPKLKRMTVGTSGGPENDFGGRVDYA